MFFAATLTAQSGTVPPQPGAVPPESPTAQPDHFIARLARATMGVKLLDLDSDDKVAAAVTIPAEEVKEDEKGTLIQ